MDIRFALFLSIFTCLLGHISSKSLIIDDTHVPEPFPLSAPEGESSHVIANDLNLYFNHDSSSEEDEDSGSGEVDSGSSVDGGSGTVQPTESGQSGEEGVSVETESSGEEPSTASSGEVTDAPVTGSGDVTVGGSGEVTESGEGATDAPVTASGEVTEPSSGEVTDPSSGEVTEEPTEAPTEPPVVPTEAPTEPPVEPTEAPTEPSSGEVTDPSSGEVTEEATEAPTDPPVVPTEAPTEPPVEPTEAPTEAPTEPPVEPTEAPTEAPTEPPVEPTEAPTEAPTEPPVEPTEAPTEAPTEPPVEPTEAPTDPPVEATEAPTEPKEPTSEADFEIIHAKEPRSKETTPLVLFALPLASTYNDEQLVCLDWPHSGNQGWYRALKDAGVDIRARVHTSHIGDGSLILYGVEVFAGPRVHVYVTKYGMRINRRVYRWGVTQRNTRVWVTPENVLITTEAGPTIIIHKVEINGYRTLIMEVRSSQKITDIAMGVLAGAPNWKTTDFNGEHYLEDTKRNLGYRLVDYKINDFSCAVPDVQLPSILRTPETDFKMANGHNSLYYFF